MMARNMVDLNVIEVDFSLAVIEPPCQDRCLQCSFWVKYSLFIINFVTWVGGGFMLGVGTWARLQSSVLGPLNDIPIDPALMVIGIGCIVILISGLACVGALRENSRLLMTFCIGLSMVFVLELAAGILAFALLGHVEEHMRQQMMAAILGYEENSEMRTTVDSLQQWYQCCGASDLNDWEKNEYYNCSSPAETKCAVPMSCCKQPTDLQCGFHVRQYSTSYASKVVHTAGCTHPLMDVFKNNLLIIGFIAFGFGFLELFSMMLAYNLIRRVMTIKKRYPDYYQDSDSST